METYKGIISGAKKVTIFEDPAESDKVLGYAHLGDEVTVLEDVLYYGINNKPYAYIRTKNFVKGYVLTELILTEGARNE